MMHLKHISISISAIATKTASMGITQAVSLEMTKAVEKGAFLLACLLMLGGASANAQNQKKKMATVEKDTIPFFRGMAVGVDVIGPVQLMVSDYGQYEASLRINLKDKYYPVFELGYGKADASDESTKINYKTSAPYARIGIDWNLLKNKHVEFARRSFRIAAAFGFASALSVIVLGDESGYALGEALQWMTMRLIGRMRRVSRARGDWLEGKPFGRDG